MSEGDFGSLVKDIFLPGSEALLVWERRTKLRGPVTSLFKYDVDKQHSRYRMSADANREYIPAYRGEFFVDEDTKMVLRVVMTPYNIPSGFPIRSLTTTLDYELANIGGKEYLLPAKANIVSDHHSARWRNVEEFRKYRKFTTETNLTFDAPDANPRVRPR